MQVVTVKALDDRMAGSLASEQCERLYPGYQAIYYEQLSCEVI